jgi:hypothetical protein
MMPLFSAFTIFDMSMALTVPILCIGVKLGAVLVTFLLPRQADTIIKSETEISGKGSFD